MRSIGDTLREQRVAHGQTSAEAAEALGLSKWTVTGLETDALPLDDVQNRAYLRMYARHLGVDVEAFLRGLKGADPLEGAPPPDEPGRPVATNRWGPNRPRQRVALLAGLALLGLVAGVLGGLVWADDRGPVEVELTAPSSSEADESSTSRSGSDTDPEPTPRSDPDDDAEPTDEPDPEPTDEPDPEPSPEPDPTAEPEPTADPVDDSGVRPPQDTRVQVLHYQASEAVLADVTRILEAAGYQIVEISSLTGPFEQATTIYAVEGWEAEGEALRDRDARFTAVETNKVFTADAHLHVAIGSNWKAPDTASPSTTS